MSPFITDGCKLVCQSIRVCLFIQSPGRIFVDILTKFGTPTCFGSRTNRIDNGSNSTTISTAVPVTLYYENSL